MPYAWLEESVVLAIHDEQLAEHGGSSGLRDRGLLESALARPRNLALYGDPDVADCAAAYAFGIVRNHPFVDGNKRTGFVCAELFATLQGEELVAEDESCITAVLGLAEGTLDEKTFAKWLRASFRKAKRRGP